MGRGRDSGSPWVLKVTPLRSVTLSPELNALLTRIDALVEDGVCTPAEAVEQRRRAFNTEVRIPPFPLPPSLSPLQDQRLVATFCQAARRAAIVQSFYHRRSTCLL